MEVFIINKDDKLIKLCEVKSIEHLNKNEDIEAEAKEKLKLLTESETITLDLKHIPRDFITMCRYGTLDRRKIKRIKRHIRKFKIYIGKQGVVL